MKTLLGLILFTVLLASCSSSNHHYSSGRSTDASVRKWKPVKDRTPYYKLMKVAERD